MNYGELRTLFNEYLNRDDCTDTQADGFISQGLRRVERQLRTPLQKDSVEYTVDDTFEGSVTIPADFLGLIGVTVNGKSLTRLTQLQYEEREGYLLGVGSFEFNSTLAEGDVIKITYYKSFPEAAEDDDLTTWTVVIDDLILFSALIYAGIFFVDSRTSEWKQFAVELLQEVQLQSDVEAMSGGEMSITPYGGGTA